MTKHNKPTDWIKTPEKQRRQALEKALDLSVDWQDAVAGFFADGTEQLSKRECAKRMIELGEELLKAQVSTGNSFGKNSQGIRHRIMVAECYLEDNPAEEATKKHGDVWPSYINKDGNKVTVIS